MLGAVVLALPLAASLACNQNRSAPTEPKQTATLTVELTASCSGSLTAIEVMLDGKLFGTVKPGETREFQIPSGSHTLDITTQGGSPSAVYHGVVSGSANVHSGFTIACTTSGVNVQVH